jgi:hypothetical protein
MSGSWAIPPPPSDRLWLIQCKRERRISPKKLKSYLAEIRLSPDEHLRGLIFAAAGDFSKASRDAFYAWCRDQGIDEALIWGKGELEDQLYQPKNDNLLFAYFGISLTIRRRSQATLIRAEIAAKRKLKKVVLSSSADVLLRDPLAEDSRAASGVWVSDNFAECCGRADPSEGHAGDPDDRRGAGCVDARALGRGEGVATAVGG